VVRLKIIDFHCDVLMKMFHDPTISFINSSKLDINYSKLRKTGSKLQYFAVYIPQNIHPSLRFQTALMMIHNYFEKIVSLPFIKHINNKYDYTSLKDMEIGTVLSLEGCDCLEDNLSNLYTLIKLGVSSVGLTWNYANSFADGALEERNAGLSKKGKELVRLLQQESILLDVSHLSEASFWDVLEMGGDLFASHSNCKAICNTPRNITDHQICSLIQKNSIIGVTFVPPLLSSQPQASITDVIRHIDHICSLGGVNNIGFGSDFDGIKQHVVHLDSYSKYPILIEQLLKAFTYEQVEGFLYKNYEKRFYF
jgi:membrane dipeptidase